MQLCGFQCLAKYQQISGECLVGDFGVVKVEMRWLVGCLAPLKVVLNCLRLDGMDGMLTEKLAQDRKLDFVGFDPRRMVLFIQREGRQECLLTLFPQMSRFAIGGNMLKAQSIIFRFSDGLGERQVICSGGTSDVLAVEECAPEEVF